MYSLGGLPHLRCLSLEGSERLRDIHLRVLAVRCVTVPPQPHATIARCCRLLSSAQPCRVCEHVSPLHSSQCRVLVPPRMLAAAPRRMCSVVHGLLLNPVRPWHC